MSAVPDYPFETDYYTVLGLDSQATLAQIRRAYRRLARQHHPDVSTDANASERFREIQIAYDVLSNPEQRKRYDHSRESADLVRRRPIEMRATTSHTVLRCLREPQMVYLLVDIRAGASALAGRIPLNLCLVLDQSTSMKGPRLDRVKQSAMHIVDWLAESDVLSVVAFNDRAEVVLSGVHPTQPGAAKRAFRSIYASGGTEIYQGLHTGLEELQRHSSPGSLDCLILLTDGHTYGDEQRCLALAQQARLREMTLSTLGVGDDWNEDFLEGIAALGGGQCSYAESSKQIPDAFEEWFRGIGSAYARDLALDAHLAEGVELRNAYRIAPRIERVQSRGSTLSLGILEVARPQCLMLEFLVACNSVGLHRLAQVELSGSLLGQPHHRYMAQQEVSVRFQNAPIEEEASIPAEILAALSKLTVYKMQEKVLDDLEAGDVGAAAQRLEMLATRLLNLGEAELARAALLEAGQVSRTGALTRAGRKRIRYGTSYLSFVPREVTHD